MKNTNRSKKTKVTSGNGFHQGVTGNPGRSRERKEDWKD